MPASLGKFKESGESVVHHFERCRRRCRVGGGAGLRARIRRRRLVAFSPRGTSAAKVAQEPAFNAALEHCSTQDQIPNRPTTVDLKALDATCQGNSGREGDAARRPLQHFQQITAIIFPEIGLKFLAV